MAECCFKNGTLYVNGVATAPVLYALSDIPGSASNTAQAQRNIRNFSDAGIQLVQVDAAIRDGWTKTQPFDFEHIFAEIAGALDANPDAGVIIRLHVNPPYWWLRDHPEEQVIYRLTSGDTPGIDSGEHIRLITNDGNNPMRASIASELWLKEAGDCVAAFCEALKNEPEGDHVIGIQVAYGIFGEWHQWGCDVSAPMERKFREYLRETYENDEALSRAWGRPVTFETAEFHPETHRPAPHGCFRDPLADRDLFDAELAQQHSTADAILHFCSIVKEHLPHIMTGTFYGYFFLMSVWDHTTIGHLLPGKLYNSGKVDFLSGPFPYGDNRKFEGIPLQRALIESVRSHGLLWLTEMDQHPAGTEQYHGGDPALFDLTVAQLRRNVLQPLLAGAGFWYYDHRLVPGVVAKGSENCHAASIWYKRGWWDTEPLMKEIKGLTDLAKDLTSRPLQKAADVLLVWNTESYYTIKRDPVGLYAPLNAVARNSVSYDCAYLEDLPTLDLSTYRLIVFVNAYYLPDTLRDSLHTLLAGKAKLWLYGAGYHNGRTLSSDNVSAAVGMTAVAHMTADNTNVVFSVTDPEAEDLGGIYKKGENYYLPSHVLTQDAFGTVCSSAGVHRYMQNGEPILAGRDVLVLTAVDAGVRTVTLRNGKTLAVDLPARTTIVLDADTGGTVYR